MEDVSRNGDARRSPAPEAEVEVLPRALVAEEESRKPAARIVDPGQALPLMQGSERSCYPRDKPFKVSADSFYTHGRRVLRVTAVPSMTSPRPYVSASEDHFRSNATNIDWPSRRRECKQCVRLLEDVAFV
ncbi:hypothetical protein KM043_002308 [Ampulex compressa]|nr:hypothetical protein KM043_002308 [Ampulex compressa]